MSAASILRLVAPRADGAAVRPLSFGWSNSCSTTIRETRRPIARRGGERGVAACDPPPPPVVGREELRKAHFKVRRASVDFPTEKEKEKAKQESEVTALLPLLPYCVVFGMLGGEQGLRQVPAAQRYGQLRRRLITGLVLPEWSLERPDGLMSVLIV